VQLRDFADQEEITGIIRYSFLMVMSGKVEQARIRFQILACLQAVILMEIFRIAS
jgi:hypothetical protein